MQPDNENPCRLDPVRGPGLDPQERTRCEIIWIGEQWFEIDSAGCIVGPADEEQAA
jgi:hypothetical protein